MISYIDDMSQVEAGHFRGFFAGWPAAPTLEQHLAVLRGSYRAVVAIGPERAVGFVTMISDGVLTAFVPWLEVLPENRRQGIGSELMRRVLAAADGCYSIDLMCDPALQPWYERLGMRRLTGMGLRNRDVLSGPGS